MHYLTRKRVLVAIVLVVLLALVMMGNDGGESKVEPERKVDAIELLPSDVLTVARKTYQSKVHFTGESRPVAEGVVSAPISGIVRQVFVKAGDNVEKGQKLLEFVDTRHKAEYLDKKGQLESGKVLLADKEEKLAHFKNLYKKQSTSKEKVRQARFDMEHQQQLVKSLEAQTHLAKRMYDQTILYAPIAGAVAWRDVEVGQAIAEGKELLKVIEVENLEVVADVHAADIHKIAVGQKAEIYPPGVKQSLEQGVVERVSPAARDISRVHSAYIRIDDVSQYLQSGMFIKGAIITEEKKDVIALHKKWIKSASAVNQAVVYVVLNNMIDERIVDVERPQYNASVVLVLSGLKEGDLLLNPKLPHVIDGRAVNLIQGL